jgi:glycosyltransferase-like protein LARGE
MLQRQCAAWPDRLAAAVYVPFVEGFGVASAESAALNGSSLPAAAQLLADAHAAAEAAPGGCALDLELVMEVAHSWEDPAVGLYPFNAVRNRALMLVRSELVLLLDVDFLPSASLPAHYRARPRAHRDLVQQLVAGRAALVLPAFETADRSEAGRGVAAAAAAGGKPAALAALAAGQLLPFQVAQYAKGHTPTNYSRWPEASQAYEVAYEMGYEPYVVVPRRFVPFYDERFRGYGRDKIVHLAHLATLGVSFWVHPDAYVVHSPHRKAATFRATKLSGQWDRLFELYLEVRRELASEAGFVPVTAFAERCARHWGAREYGAAQAAAAQAAEALKQRAKAAAAAARRGEAARGRKAAAGGP